MFQNPSNIGQLGLVETQSGSGGSVTYPWDNYPIGDYYGYTAVLISADYWQGNSHNSYQLRILRRPSGVAEIGHILTDREEILGFTYDDLSIVNQNGTLHLVVTPQGSVTGVTAHVRQYVSTTF